MSIMSSATETFFLVLVGNNFQCLLSIWELCCFSFLEIKVCPSCATSLSYASGLQIEIISTQTNHPWLRANVYFNWLFIHSTLFLTQDVFAYCFFMKQHFENLTALTLFWDLGNINEALPSLIFMYLIDIYNINFYILTHISRRQFSGRKK